MAWITIKARQPRLRQIVALVNLNASVWPLCFPSVHFLLFFFLALPVMENEPSRDFVVSDLLYLSLLGESCDDVDVVIGVVSSSFALFSFRSSRIGHVRKELSL